MSSGSGSSDGDPDGSGVETELGDAQRARSGERIEFYGGKWMSALPLVIFILWAIFQSALLGIGDTTGLVAAMLVALIVGMLFVKGDWQVYANTIVETNLTQR